MYVCAGLEKGVWGKGEIDNDYVIVVVLFCCWLVGYGMWILEYWAV